MSCPECSTALVAGARFCHRCGREARAVSPSRSVSPRPAWKRWTTGISLGLLGAVLLLMLLIPRGDSDATLIPGQVAPDFDLPALSGGRVRLSELRGRPVIINFWATWCTPCRKEMPEFQALAERYADSGLAVLGINVGESIIGVTEFVRSVGVTFPILIDDKEAAQTAYKILPLPATFFIDRKGTVRAVYQFQMNQVQMESEVQRLLAQ